MSGWVLDWATRLGELLGWFALPLALPLVIGWAVLHHRVAFASWDRQDSSDVVGIEIFDEC